MDECGGVGRMYSDYWDDCVLVIIAPYFVIPVTAVDHFAANEKKKKKYIYTHLHPAKTAF